MADFNANYQTKPTHQLENPRKVRGGVRLTARVAPEDLPWIANTWFRAIMQHCDPAIAELGTEYAQLGQTRTIETEPGIIKAVVQGRAPRGYRITITLPIIEKDKWEPLLRTMADQAVYAANLLSGEVPDNITELFDAQELSLFCEPQDIKPTCTCDDFKEGQWCKHAACAAIISADLLRRDPLLIFTLRGMPTGELLERLRAARAFTNQSNRHVRQGGPVELDTNAPTLQECAPTFFDAGPGLDLLETPLRKPDVSHPLLRRLGPSPFGEGKFPLVGLLATCYDTISEAVIKRETENEEG
jgi:uncharacterized Zn finger protein